MVVKKLDIMEETKVPTTNEVIPEKIVQTFYVALYRNPGNEWIPGSAVPQYTKESALRDIESLKQYKSFERTEFKLISFDIETEI